MILAYTIPFSYTFNTEIPCSLPRRAKCISIYQTEFIPYSFVLHFNTETDNPKLEQCFLILLRGDTESNIGNRVNELVSLGKQIEFLGTMRWYMEGSSTDPCPNLDVVLNPSAHHVHVMSPKSAGMLGIPILVFSMFPTLEDTDGRQYIRRS